MLDEGLDVITMQKLKLTNTTAPNLDRWNEFLKRHKNPKAEVIVTDNKNVALPTTTITCYKCGGTKGYWWTVQTRSADEAPTNFIRCAKCGNTWRSSN